MLEDKHTKGLAGLELAQATIDKIRLENDITRITALSVIDDRAVLSKHIENTQVIGENLILGHDFAAVREHMAMEREIEEETEQAPQLPGQWKPEMWIWRKTKWKWAWKKKLHNGIL